MTFWAPQRGRQVFVGRSWSHLRRSEAYVSAARAVLRETQRSEAQTSSLALVSRVLKDLIIFSVGLVTRTLASAFRAVDLRFVTEGMNALIEIIISY